MAWPNIAQRRSRLDLSDADEHGFALGLHQAPGQHAGGTDETHATGIAKPAILEGQPDERGWPMGTDHALVHPDHASP